MATPTEFLYGNYMPCEQNVCNTRNTQCDMDYDAAPADPTKYTFSKSFISENGTNDVPLARPEGPCTPKQ